MTEHPDSVMSRHASALDEIRRMHMDYRTMQQELLEARRTIDQQANMISLLKSDAEKHYSEARLYQRKLIRLCGTMKNIGLLSEEAMAIMQDARDYEEQADNIKADKDEDTTADQAKAEAHAALIEQLKNQSPQITRR